MHNYT